MKKRSIQGGMMQHVGTGGVGARNGIRRRGMKCRSRRSGKSSICRR